MHSQTKNRILSTRNRGYGGYKIPRHDFGLRPEGAYAPASSPEGFQAGGEGLRSAKCGFKRKTYLIQKHWQECSHKVFFAAASWTTLHRPLAGPFRLVQRITIGFNRFLPYQHKRAGCFTGIRCGSKKDLVTKWIS